MAVCRQSSVNKLDQPDSIFVLHRFRSRSAKKKSLIKLQGSSVCARIEGCKPIFSDSSSIDSYVQDCISKAESMENGRKALDLQSVDFADTERFILENTKEIRTELQLFLVSEKSRGTGIGSQLFERFLKACGDNAASDSLVSGDSASACASSACASSAGARFFLFTDSTCNWQWYQRRGLVRIAQKMSSDPKIDLGADKFIYADIYVDKPV